MVMWRKDLYCNEAKKQISSEQFYMKLDCEITNKISKTIKKNSIISKDELQKKTALNNLVDNPKCSNFYMFAKFPKFGYTLVGLSCPLVLARQL